MKRIKELDGLRAIAVSMVVVEHCQTMAPLAGGLRILVNGRLGVIIFFVLSGYLITRLLTDEQRRTGGIRLGAFYARRAFRILPASYTYVIVVAAAAAASIASVAWQELILAAVHLWNYVGVILAGQESPQGRIVLGHFWSLAIEEQFYCFWPLLLIIATARNARSLLFAIVLGMPLVRLGVYALWPAQRGYLGMMFHTAIDPLAIGALIAIYEQPLRDRIVRLHRHWVSLAIVGLLLVSPLLRNVAGAYWTITYGVTIDAAVAAFVILAVAHRPEHGFAGVLRSAPFQFIGAISFSLYLWQQAFCIRDGMFAMHPVFAVPASIAVATISYYGIEKSFLAWRKRAVARVSEPAPVF